MSDFTRRSISLPGQEGEVALVEFGDPDRPVDVIFAHANGFNALTYRQALAPLGERMRIVALDQRGHGRTTLTANPDAKADWSDLRDDLLALINALGINNPVVLAGHSMGGRACLTAAALAPDRVKALVLLDPVLFRKAGGVTGPSDAGAGLMEGALRRRRRFDSREAAIQGWQGRGAYATWPSEALADFATDGLVEDETGVQLACAPEWEAAGYRTSQGGEYAVPLLYAVSRPTLVLKGAIGSTCSPGPDDPETRSNPHLDIRVIEGASHFLPMERPDLVREALTWAVSL